MIGVFNTIELNNTELFRGNNFTLQREWIYAAEIETCTGKRCADRVGWRYQDLTIEWDCIPQSQLQTVLALTGQEVELVFSDESNTSVTERVIPTVLSSQVTRFTDDNGDIIWRGIQLQLKFIEAHN